MKLKTSLVLIIFLFCGLSIFPQKAIADSFKFKATYTLSARLDSTSTNLIVNEDMILLIGDRLSSFSSKALSVEQRLKVYGKSGHTSKTAVTEFPYILIKNREDKNRYYTQNIVENQFLYKEVLNDFQWVFSEETKTYKGYTCKRASTNWKGRSYVVWYTEEIPIAEVPYKFSGLPGLIVEISDTNNDYHFELIGFEKLKEPIKFKLRFKDFIKLRKDKLTALYRRYLKDPFTYINNPNITISEEVHRRYIVGFAKRLKERNNAMEKK